MSGQFEIPDKQRHGVARPGKFAPRPALACPAGDKLCVSVRGAGIGYDNLRLYRFTGNEPTPVAVLPLTVISSTSQPQRTSPPWRLIKSTMA